MTRYTRFESLATEAEFADDKRFSVWLRDQDSRLSVKAYNGYPTEYYFKGLEITEDQARDLFDLEMRVFGWVSTNRTEGRLTRDY